MNDDTRDYGGRIQTYEGQAFPVFAPERGTVSIFDIAHSHSLTCRWAGHTRFHYPLSQHGVLVSELVQLAAPEEPWKWKWGLLHDGTEFVLQDIARPVKVKMPVYYDIEKPLQDHICDVFGLPRKMPKEVRWADDVLLVTEARDLLRPITRNWPAPMPAERFPRRIRPWPMWYAEYRFLKRYTEITGEPTLKRFLSNKLDDYLSLLRPVVDNPHLRAGGVAVYG